MSSKADELERWVSLKEQSNCCYKPAQGQCSSAEECKDRSEQARLSVLRYMQVDSAVELLDAGELPRCQKSQQKARFTNSWRV